MLSHLLAPFAFRSHAHYHRAIATERKRTRGDIQADAGFVHSQGPVRKFLTNLHGTKTAYRPIFGFQLVSRQRKVCP
jgi:hypothetical protein